MSTLPVTNEYCAARSGGIERVQQLSERRIEGQGQKLDDLTKACLQLTGAVERITVLLERQEQRLNRVEERSPYGFFETAGGKALMRAVGVGLLLLLCSALGLNALKILEII